MTAHMPSFPAYAQTLDEALAFIREGDHFLVVAHVQPDGDAISSTLVVSWLLGQLGKTFVMVNESAVPLRLGFLDGAAEIRLNSDLTEERPFDRIIAVDCADFRRIGVVADRFAPDAKLLNVDHHPTNDGFGTTNLIRPDAAATVEILYDLIVHAGLTLDLPAATAVYTGLLTDTGGFRYSNTTPHVMQTAASLLELGVAGHRLAEHLLEKMTKAQLLLLQKGLANLAFSSDNRIAWIQVDIADLQATGASSEDLEGLVNYARNVEGVDVGILFKETTDGCVKVSLRSSGAADVSAIARSFGGGGHVRAAGCRFEAGMATVVDQVVQAVSEALKA
ncbi:phosphoesterase RecJ-like protein [Paenibacillus phyllosphaerae]|uniref:Phosphoesterase RecJ-like protein n=1 Tax=Paenibacillus phyllosphaerae TaxID=274593 RepID=A0A7W5FLU8_9BACL|nr:bifunctional oligoribonuclease/PAP phosphatase NrnA [Paenibacillus phyllosphaerae]MBB3109438.1 phosphoesterase RecJ-like protein [Paenibacillus phyllosphaerae]